MKKRIKQILLPFTFVLSILSVEANADIAQMPLFVGGTASPLVMLTMGKDHKLYYEAYNDASDLDDDGVLEIHYKPSIDYLGYFDSYKCYDYSSSVFEPDLSSYDPDPTTATKTCSGNWSGDYLNYLTTSRMDALRKVLYGGTRKVDTATETILERVYIPQDAHSWGKEYTSIGNDGYDISDYTPYAVPTGGRRHLFGSVTPLAPSNVGGAPELRVLLNEDIRIWEWASTEGPVLNSRNGADIPVSSYDAILDVFVRVCVAGMLEPNCKAYGSGPSYKPTGILHDYGESEEMLFGLLTGSFDKNMSGGVLRKNIESFINEIDNDTGVILDSDGIINTIDKLRILAFNNNGVYEGGWPTAWITTRPMDEGETRDWGNPIAEMMYESVRYFAGKASPTPAFVPSTSQLDLPTPSWQDPYRSEDDGGHPYCAKPLQLVISDINPSFDTDQLPGSSFASFAGDLPGLNVSTLADTIWAGESESSLIFIGESNGVYDGSPSAKIANSFKNIRGLSPEEPTKQGGYYSASVAMYAKQNDISAAESEQTIDTLAVVLASPIPTIDFNVGGQQIKLVPFAKSTAALSINHAEGDFQPTNQIVDFYVAEIANTTPANTNIVVNGGRPYGKFRINYEDVEQGADHDMDAIVTYTVEVTPAGKLKVSLSSDYASGSINHHIGYIISGTTADGIYLEVRDFDTDPLVDVDYFLDTPPGELPSGNWNDGVPLELTAERTFTPGLLAAGSFIKHDPLWYAVKWSATDGNEDGVLTPDEWDGDGDGDPDGYYLVTNAGKLQQQLEESFAELLSRTSAGGAAVTVNSSRLNTNSKIYQASFETDNWQGHFKALEINADGSVGAIVWDAADKIPTNRDIYTYDPITNNGIGFNYADLNAGQQALLDHSAAGTFDGNGALRADYIRGDRSEEGGLFRSRASLMGDLVNSSPALASKTENFGYTRLPGAAGTEYSDFRTDKLSRRNAIYFGSNGGMLHAIDAELGDELFTYIPDAVIGNLNHLTAPNYSHRYFVDGDVKLFDAYVNSDWKTILIGSLGRGGKGVFALDVTDPDSFGAGKVMWEFSDLQAPGGAVDLAEFQNNLGYTLPESSIVRMNNGNFYALVANGYESVSGKAVLYIIDVETGEILSALDTGTAGGNGLSAPIPVDEDGDFIVDVIYAGDLLGNMWRFDVSATSESAWYSELLFVAQDDSGLRQPITAKPQVGTHPDGGFMVYFGTGKYYGIDDVNIPAGIQSFYGIRDDATGTTVLSDPRDAFLQQQTIDYEGAVSNSADFLIRVTSEHATDYTSKKGWYMDLESPVNGVEGERVVRGALLRDGRIIFVTIIPNEDPCAGGGISWIMEMDAVSGSRLSETPFDVNNDGEFNEEDFVEITLPDGTTIKVPVSGVRDGNDGGMLGGLAVITTEDGNEHKYGGDSNANIFEIGESAGDPVGRKSWRDLPYAH